jgi:hypothetical protein
MNIIDYKPVGKGYLQGTFNLKIEKWGNCIMRDLCFFQKGDRKWITLPSRQYEENGEKKFFPLITFEDAKMLSTFQRQVLTALEIHIAEHKI